MKKTVRVSYEVLSMLIGALFLFGSLVSQWLWRSQPILWDTYPLLSASLALVAMMVSGGEVFWCAIRKLWRRDFLDETFLMSIAALCAFFIGEFTEGVAVILFYRLGEYLEHKAVRKSRAAIKALMAIKPDTAIVLHEGTEIEIDAEDVAVGDTIVLSAGARVPVDCTVLTGSGSIDTSCLTGESLPRDVEVGDALLSGVIVTNARLTARCDKPASESSASRVLALVETANEQKSKQERFIARFAKIYTPLVVGAAVLLAFLPPLITGFSLSGFLPWLRRAMMLLVVSCPCALVISVPLAFFGGIGNAASHGILFKGGTTFHPLRHADTIIFDKTGTLTHGCFAVTRVIPRGIDKERLLSLAASAEHGSSHPIAQAILQACPTHPLPLSIRELSGQGVVATLPEGEIAVGNAKLMKTMGVELPQTETGVFVALNGTYFGTICVSDVVKESAKDAIDRLHELGIRHTVMLTGDLSATAEAVGTSLGIDLVRAELLPEEKFAHLQSMLKTKTAPIVYVGDGINDAPSLALSDVGVAMGGVGSDAAIESADIVIMNDDLTKLAQAKQIAQKTLSIATANIVFALGIKLAVMCLATLGVLDFSGGMWIAVFADVGVALLAILNSLRMVFDKKQ